MDVKIPKGKYLSSVKVGQKGQIVIPKELRDMFKIKCGDTLLLLGDDKQGIGIVPFEKYQQFANALFEVVNKEKGE